MGNSSLKIPQKNIGQVRHAFQLAGNPKELDVDILLRTKPERIFKGKLAWNRVAAEANPDRTDNNENEPIVYAWVRIEGNDIPEDYRMTPEMLVSGTEVSTRIRCGLRPMGYSLFSGMWEFLFEKVVFWF